MAEPLLSVRGLTRRFESPGGLGRRARVTTAVRDVSLDVARGEVVGVVGESGCGKSTLARLVLALVPPTAGRVVFDGTDLGGLAPRALRAARRRMAMVFQDPYSSLDPRWRLADALAEPFRAQGLPIPAGRIDELLDAVGLARGLGAAYPHQLSGGQRQRAGIARALALHPDLLVLDEPTASLDVSIQAQIVSLLERLQRDLGLTYLFISHDLGLVRYFCTRIVVMYLGAVVEVLPAPKAPPRHPYTRALVDSSFPPDPERRRTLTAITGEVPSADAPPPGCAFAARCPRAAERCRTDPPPVLLASPDGHAVACHFPLPADRLP